MKHLLTVCLALAGCFTTAPAAPSRGPASGRPPVSASGLERGVHEATNAARRRERLGSVASDAALATVARRHSADMLRRGYFAHTSPDGQDANDRTARDQLLCRVSEGPRTYTGFSENLAQVWLYSGWRETRSVLGTQRTYDWRTADEVVRETVDGWLGSPGHRRNLLLRHATREGIGVAIGDDGKVFVTQVLC